MFILGSLCKMDSIDFLTELGDITTSKGIDETTRCLRDKPCVNSLLGL